jgi:hypothetical protein
MTVDFVYKICQFIANKNQQGYIKPADFNIIINSAQYSFLDYLLGEFQQYQNGRPVARVELGQNEAVRQRLTPFIDAPTTLTIGASGLVAYPDDFQAVDAMYTSAIGRIVFVQQHKLYSHLESVIDPISSNPIYLIQSDGFQFYPNTNYNNVTLTSAKLSYVKTPTTITWGYTLDVNGRPVYDPATSADPAWYDVDMFEIISRALRMVGVNLQSQEVSQFAEQVKQQGQ